MRADDVVALSAVQQRRLIGQRKLSPVELMRACIARMEALNPGVNALAATDFERALVQARVAEGQVMRGEALGALHGLPLGVKDLQNTAGLLTTYGNVALRGIVPTEDIGLVARLKAAGAIVTAKTNVPDMGAGANTRNPVWGATGNPFDPALHAGGSSGGSAAALACDMLPLCTGSDTGGSLRIPAALCGVAGLRPSPSMVANTARPLGWSAISVLGPMGRDVADTALLMAASVGFDAREPLSAHVAARDFLHLPQVDLSRLRVGFTEDFGLCAVDAGIRRSFRHRVAALRPWVARCDPWQPGLGDADRAWAHLEQTRLARQFAAAFDDFDVLLSPVTPLSPFPWTELFARQVDGQAMRNGYQWLGLTCVATLATNPALSLPCGLDEAGMPFGLQMVGRLNGDAMLLGAARALEQAFEGDATLCRPRPDAQRLRQPRPALRAIVTHPPTRPEPDGSLQAVRPVTPV